ncbi:hypothetical protein ACE1B6_03620 [Aerosakkonemataceae cyanobacterium BLCC-F154]|uniref:Uncharacterized protein n=1 Tax=Floridaenema fluviatile BLCC-F154 TaxID=3153640 RepID=A0ABV4Y6B8_9CYAN
MASQILFPNVPELRQQLSNLFDVKFYLDENFLNFDAITTK